MNSNSIRSFSAIIAAIVLMSVSLDQPVQAQESEEPITTEVAVHVGQIVRTTLHGIIMAYGTVIPQKAGEHSPPAGSSIASQVAGIIDNVSCVEGQRVEKGAILFHLDSRVADVEVDKTKDALRFAEKNLQRQKQRIQTQIAALDISREKAEETLAFAQQNFERQKKLLKTNGTSQKNYQEAEHQLATAQNDLAAIQSQQTLLQLSTEQADAEQQLMTAQNDLKSAQTYRDLLDVRAPFSGTVTSVRVNPGEAVDVSSIVAELIDLNRLELTASIPSREASRLKPGQTVMLANESNSTAFTKEQTSEDAFRLSYVSPHIDAQTDTALIRVTLPPNSGLRPGQFVPFRIVYEQHNDCLAVPFESVVNDEDGQRVIAVVEGNKAVQKPVKEGLREGSLVEIEGEGLQEGLTVVTEGAYGLPNESVIRIVSQ